MKNVIIYTRVSTDEQAEKGFSLRNQKEVLLRYCGLKKLQVLEHFQDDYSAKTFDRPEWKKLMVFCKANRKQVDAILFTKWDRFTRNTGEAYQVIKQLRHLGIGVNAVEQPLEIDQPDSKVLLALYLTLPEVENDKISIRVSDGMHRAKKEGCWTTKAPYGYKNQRTSDGKSSLIPSEKAPLILEAFQILVDTQQPIEELRRVMRDKGLKIPRSRFYTIFRNPVYIGKIVVPAYKNEDLQIVEGLHQGIIPQPLFNHVQDILDGRKRKNNKWSKNEQLPLRGYMQCSKCGNTLTGSASTGRFKKKYYYYHCKGNCKERLKVAEVHQVFDTLLSSLTLSPGKAALYLQILRQQLGANKVSKKIKLTKLKQEVSRLKQILEQAEDNLFEGKIDLKTFEKGKARYTRKISELESEILELKDLGSNELKKIKEAVNVFKNLRSYYNLGSLETKQMILGSIFSEKLVFEKNKCRTTKFNTVIEHIFQTTRQLQENKTGQELRNSDLSRLVDPQGGFFQGGFPTFSMNTLKNRGFCFQFEAAKALKRKIREHKRLLKRLLHIRRL